MYLTWLDSNSWLIEMGGKRILLDPWLVGPLVFGNINWLFKGSRPQERPIPDRIDLILLSQGLEDHTHPPTLQQLDRSIPVVASPSAAKVVRELGYHQVTTLSHGESFNLDNQVTIQALPGSPIGPFVTENAYFLKELASELTLYYEPHGYHAPVLKEMAPIDVVITPVIDMKVPVLGPIIQGKNSAFELAEMVQPQVMLPTAAGGDVTFEGVLMAVIQTMGSADTLRTQLAASKLSIQLLEPKPGDRVELKLQRRAITKS
ncbi:MBL fold metallo-hydrolase [Trichocoleus sp. FACHB-262]|uniref:MBL fold metallo-hydrolase n=1 Tax=Trichocoleus sp. FACHB-262 TaxID=2692869 RepID=UPI00168486C8|nr:MBL fold metallo-hydrolase [Trichocoleus sp. FACHB-262]MBD2124364.1 MBL fold metallo-hydrolase [Trichocoleus sp. FACHB-262]